MVSASTPLANEPARTSFLSIQRFSGRMVSSGISDVAFASVYSEKPV